MTTSRHLAIDEPVPHVRRLTLAGPCFFAGDDFAGDYRGRGNA